MVIVIMKIEWSENFDPPFLTALKVVIQGYTKDFPCFLLKKNS
jgi:hypothetical protein